MKRLKRQRAVMSVLALVMVLLLLLPILGNILGV